MSNRWRQANGQTVGRAMRLPVVFALTWTLSACGGGGGSGGSSDASVNSIPTIPTIPDTTPTSISPDMVITPDSPTYATMLSTDLVTKFVGDTDHTPTVVSAPVWTISGGRNGLVLSTSGTGMLSSILFLGSQTLPATSIQLVPSTRTVQGQSTIQFMGSAMANRYYPYASSVQWFTGAGITAVGLGQWKYMGEQQTTLQPSFINSGRQLSAGAFLMGTPTATSALSRVVSGRYQGQMQALVDDGRYGDDFAHLTATVTATLDVAKAQVTLQLTTPGLLGGTMGSTGVFRSSWTETFGVNWMPQVTTCNGSIDLQTGRFSCPFSGLLSGTAQGQLFGTAGDQLAATFSTSTLSYGIDIRPVVVGGLAAKRVGNLP